MSATVDTRQGLGNAGRLLDALDLEGLRDGELQAARDLVDLRQRRTHADARADRDGRREADLVVAVVQAEGEALEAEHRVGELGAERERVKAVGDRPAE